MKIRLILFLTVFTVLLAAHTAATVYDPQIEGAEPQKILYIGTIEEEAPVHVENPVEDVEKEAEPAFTEDEHEILAIIIYQEAGGNECSDDTRRKVGSVFLNRVHSPLFPDTFEEVALGKRQYGTLYWTGLKWPDRAAQEVETHAVQRAYDIAEELLVGGSILPENVIWQAEFKQGDGTYCFQDGFYFCYSEVNK